MFSFRRLQHELTLSLILLTLSVLLILGLAGVWIILQSQQRSIMATQDQVATRVSQEVHHLISYPLDQLQLMKKLSWFDDRDLAMQERLLFDFLHGQSAFDYFVLYNADSDLLLKMHRQQPRHAVGVSLERHNAAIDEVLASGDAYFGGLSYDTVTGEPNVLVALPIINMRTGRIDQVLVSTLRFRALWQIMAREAREAASSARTVFLVADDERVIAHPNPAKVLARKEYPVGHAAAGLGLAGDAAIVAESTLPMGTRDYRIVAEQPAINIVRAAASYAVILLSALLVALAAAVVMSLWLSRRITRPLDALVSGAKEITAGDLNTRIAVYGRNELAVLGRQFNHMTIQLRQSIAQLQDNALELASEVESRRAAQASLSELNQQLEQRVAERTAQLSASLQELELAQASLVQSEKLAGLGALVAGIAHELNTPIGNALMMASTLQARCKEMADKLQQGLRRSDLDNFMAVIGEGCEIMNASLRQSTRLITSFKQVAVDQTSYQRRPFVVEEVVEEITLSMAPAIRRQGLQVHLSVDEDIRLDSYPGPLGQILLNLINNAMVHAFNGAGGELWVSARAVDIHLVLQVRDNGCGIDEQAIGKIFDPFYTSRLGQGGSGLGLNIVFNLVNGLLGGHISVESQLGEGTCFTLTIPLVAPDANPTMGA